MGGYVKIDGVNLVNRAVIPGLYEACKCALNCNKPLMVNGRWVEGLHQVADSAAFAFRIVTSTTTSGSPVGHYVDVAPVDSIRVSDL